MLTAQIYKRDRFLTSIEVLRPTQFGRQDKGEPAPPTLYTNKYGKARFIFEKVDEQALPRRIATLSPLDMGSFELSNDRLRHDLLLGQGPPIAPEAKRIITVPCDILVGAWRIHVASRDAAVEASFASLSGTPRVPGSSLPSSCHQLTLADTFPEEGSRVDYERVFRCLSAALDVVEHAASTSTFFQNAAEAVTQIAGLERAAIMLREENQWNVKAEHAPVQCESMKTRLVSTTVLDRVRDEKRTVMHYPHMNVNVGKSLADIHVVIAAPILSQSNDVLGVIYADHGLSGQQYMQADVGKLEAMFVELVASAVSAGIARLDREREAMRARVQFEEFFTTELAAKLEDDPDMLKPREQDVSVMSCDIRGFSRIAERVGPEVAMRWINDVLDELSSVVLDSQGVVVDYVGDELMAMWGAPDQQPDHAQRACNAALEIVSKTETLAVRWRKQLGEPFRVGIGINSGLASVGNTGSRRKFKYGPLGNTVNVASRVQGLTKHLGTSVLITEETASQLERTAGTRRICTTRLVNIGQTVGLCELTGYDDSKWEQLKTGYEAALAAFEDRHFVAAAKMLGELLVSYPDDSPSRQLLVRAAAALGQEGDPPDTVWQFEGK